MADKKAIKKRKEFEKRARAEERKYAVPIAAILATSEDEDVRLNYNGFKNALIPPLAAAILATDDYGHRESRIKYLNAIERFHKLIKEGHPETASALSVRYNKRPYEFEGNLETWIGKFKKSRLIEYLESRL